MPTIPHSSTAQEVFDYVANHLRKQGRPSLRPKVNKNDSASACAYRGMNGLTCAVGCLMTDAEYQEEFEGDSIHTLVSCSMIVKEDEKDTFWQRHLDLLSALQTVHDSGLILLSNGEYASEDLEGALRKVAEKFNLTIKEPV